MERTGACWRAILFWGAIWGILESTVGALMHLLPVRLGFLVWVPMAMGCMLGAYRATGKARAVLSPPPSQRRSSSPTWSFPFARIKC